MASYTPNEMMTIAAARALKSDDVCFVGIGMPSAACNLARLTHAPDITLIYESGTIATKPDVLPLSIGDGELCDTALTTVAVPGYVYQPDSGRWAYRPGPLQANVVLVDEVNRITPRTQSALLEAMAEGQVTLLQEAKQEIDAQSYNAQMAGQRQKGDLSGVKSVTTHRDSSRPRATFSESQ